MLQELQKSAGAEATCRSNKNVQVLHTKSPAQSDCCPAQNSVAPAQSSIDHGYRPGCECSGCKATARICAELAGNSPVIPDTWIPVSERMPEDDDFVYIWPRPDFGVELHVGQYCERSHKGGGWYAQFYEQNYGIEWHPITVTHWMPLPAGPQGVKGE
ncbi:TPA: DUF551 domain-containing protein [Klebsiella pneumoniae]